MDYLHDATIFLAAAVLAVPIFRYLGLGAVLGYLTAGLLIGPQALGLVGNATNILHFAEIGVVFLLFVIGLELRPQRLWVLRRSVFGLGLLQVITAAAAIGGLLVVAGAELRNAAVLGLALALSSTAFVLQLLAEKKELTASHGRASFAVLLFQDIAVIPILALLPVLGSEPHASPEEAVAWWDPLVIPLALVAFVAGGRYLLRPALRAVAYAQVHEIFIAAALLLVLGAAVLMESLGISMALGAFVAGVLLADSEYRHELEASIEPFKGLLLGLFFLAVGMTLDVQLLLRAPLQALGLALLLMVVKSVLLFAVARIMGIASIPARRAALLLSQGGEFAFVILAAARPLGLLDDSTASMAALVVTLSMALTPLLALVDERLLVPWLDGKEPPRSDEPEPEASSVIIAGFGRTGQIVARVLRAKGIEFTALERDPEHLDFVRRFGNKVYFGDAGHMEVMRAAGVAEARLLVLTINDAEDSLRIARMVRAQFPQIAVFAAARNRAHALALREVGVEYVMRMAYCSSLELSTSVLRKLGESPERAARAVALFREHDEETLERQFEFHHDTDALVQSSKDAADELKLILEADEPLDDERSSAA